MRSIARKSATRKNESIVFSEGGGFADALKDGFCAVFFVYLALTYSRIPGKIEWLFQYY